MAEYIVGLKEYAERLQKAARPGEWLDLREYPLEGVTRIDAQTYRVTLKGRYPQFVYWLAMPFFARCPGKRTGSSSRRAWWRRISRSTGGRSVPGPTCCP